MKGLDIHYLCRMIGSMAGIPIRIFEDGKLDFYYCVVRLPKDPIALNWEDIRRIESHVGYFVTEHFYYYGIINAGSTKIVLGPARQIPDTPQALRELAYRLDVPSEETAEFVESMGSIVAMPLESIMQILCTMNYVLNDEKLELADITIYEPEQNQLKEPLERQRSDRIFSYIQVPQDLYEHNTYTQEQQLLRYVRKGDTSALREWIASAPAIQSGHSGRSWHRGCFFPQRYVYPEMRTAPFPGSDHESAIPHGSGIYGACGAAPVSWQAHPAYDCRDELHSEPSVPAHPGGGYGQGILYEPPLSLRKIQGRNRGNPDGLHS